MSHPVFRGVWITNVVTNFGGMIQSVGASWTMSSIASAKMTALVQASVSLPIMLLALLAGALADTLDRRRLMLTAQIFMLLMSVVLAGVTAAGWITPWLLLSFTFLIGCGSALNGPAWQASVGDMVPRRDLAGAVTLNAMGYNIARSAGPAVGGVIVAAAGAAVAFAVNAVSYLGLIVVLFRWKPEAPAQAPGSRLLAKEGVFHAMGAGLRYTAMSPRIYAVLLRSFVFGIAAGGVQSLLAVVARHGLGGGGPLVFGLLLGAFGAGAVGGALLSARLRARFSTEGLIRLTCVAYGLAALTLGLSPWLWLTMPALMAGGAAWVLTLSTLNVTVQMSVPRWVLARVLAIYQMSAFGGLALGSWIWGSVAQGQGTAVALCLAAALHGVCLLIGLRLPLPAANALNLDLLSRWTEPQVAVSIEPRSGPVVIEIEYIIEEADTPAFLAAMAERRRIRRRDGAKHWTLARDLGDARIWVERYITATWTDYVRHNQRKTHQDAWVTEAIHQLHQGERPRIHRMIERSPSIAADARDPRGMPELLTDVTQAS